MTFTIEFLYSYCHSGAEGLEYQRSALLADISQVQFTVTSHPHCILPQPQKLCATSG